MSIKIRPFKIGDGGEVQNLLRQLSTSQRDTRIIDLDAVSITHDDNCHCMVIEDHGIIIGFGTLIIHQVPVDGWVARFEDIVVDCDYRGQGLGKKLCQELIKIAKGKNVKHIDLTSNPKRMAAGKLYEALGFRQRDTRVYRLKL